MKEKQEKKSFLIFLPGEGDEDGDIEADFMNWTRLIWPLWCLEYGISLQKTTTEVASIVTESDNVVSEVPRPNFKVRFVCFLSFFTFLFSF